ncbi:SUMF1/EgtB/PvdO family nonheme iron enzyme [Leptothoe sp. EHU-05/26/07-4]
MSSSGSIFISYRRSDSIAETGRIYDRLVTAFGKDRVYKDVDSIPLGSDFAEELDKAVGQCQVLLVIIGKTWVSATEVDGAKRLDNPDDFVRIEVESALKRNIPVIPVLLEGASLPKRMQLPESLHKLARRNGTQVGYDPRFHADMDRLVKAIKDLLQSEASSPKTLVSQSAQLATASQEPATRENKPQETTNKSSKTLNLGNGVALELLYISSGKFLMGSPQGEGRGDELPQHEVAVPEFWMGKYPVTQEQYQAVMEENPSIFRGDNFPVECVTWHNAAKFCETISQQTGQPIRLPSEAEWEYACRAETRTPFSFGAILTAGQANFSNNVLKTTPVGRYSPNNFGLYDMHGNVWEWCQDHMHSNYLGAPTDGSAWTQGGNSNFRMVRGGSWDNRLFRCRSAARLYVMPAFRRKNFGFRVTCSP